MGTTNQHPLSYLDESDKKDHAQRVTTAVDKSKYSSAAPAESGTAGASTVADVKHGELHGQRQVAAVEDVDIDLQHQTQKLHDNGTERFRLPQSDTGVTR